MLSNLLAGYMKANPTVQARMVAAYVIGFSITQQYLDANPHLGFATGPDDTGVIVSYNTEAPDVAVGANPVLSTTGIGLVMNPLSWSRDETYVPANDPRNLGVSPVLKALLPALPAADAQIDTAKGVLVCANAPESTMFAISPGLGVGVYHSFDYLFYYNNLTVNAANRAAKYLAAH